jgi:hypothetical protein
MRLGLLPVLPLAFTGLMWAGPVLAQGGGGPQSAPAPAAPAAPAPPALATTAPSASKVMTPPDADEAFVTGLRRVGVMAGQAVQCSTTPTDRQAQISEAMELANQIALHFGLRAAFNFVGALGYGSGKPFDKTGCSQAIDGWKEIKAKYLNK